MSNSSLITLSRFDVRLLPTVFVISSTSAVGEIDDVTGKDSSEGSLNPLKENNLYFLVNVLKRFGSAYLSVGVSARI